MLRVICLMVDSNSAVHVGGPVHKEYKTFECVDAESIGRMLDWLSIQMLNVERSIVGVEPRF